MGYLAARLTGSAPDYPFNERQSNITTTSSTGDPERNQTNAKGANQRAL
jgi:hypothetical protein